MTIKTAADSLLSKNEISPEEHNALLNIEKKAGIADLLRSIKSGVGSKVKGAADTVFNISSQNALRAAAGIATAGVIGKEAYGVGKQKYDIGKSYKNIKEKTPSLENYGDDQIKDYFNVVKTFSPRAASNPLVAGALVNKMLEYGGVDHKLIQDLVNIEPGLGEGTKSLMTGVVGSMVGLDKGERLTSDGTFFPGDAPISP